MLSPSSRKENCNREKGTQLKRFECFRPVSDLPYAIIIPDMVLVVEAPMH